MKLLALVISLISAALVAPATAGTLNFDVNGVLGPDLSGVDPLNLTGDAFTASGTLDASSLPVFTSGDSAIYDLSDLQIALGKLDLIGYNAMLTLTVPSSGLDIVSVDFSVDEYGFTPDVDASFSLPAGTLKGTAIQQFSAEETEPAGELSFGIPDSEDATSGSVGITGTVSLCGSSSASVPEPGTLGLAAAAALALAIGWTIKRRAASRPQLTPAPLPRG